MLLVLDSQGEYSGNLRPALEIFCRTLSTELIMIGRLWGRQYESSLKKQEEEIEGPSSE